MFDTWLAGTRATAIDENVLMVEAPNPFIVESIERRMYHTVLKSVQSVVGPELDVRFYVSSLGDTPVNALNMRAATDAPAPPTLNDQYTFASFAIGPSNQLAVSAARAVSEDPGTTYNPLFIYAAPGLGKTHLMHAIAHASYQRGAVVRYITSEGFANEFIQGIRTKTTEEFRRRYRSVDILLVDDIQFLKGKEQTIEGFFHTINDLHTFRKQLVLASELPPQRMEFLDNKLRSRLQSGLTAQLMVPDSSTKLSILQAKCKALGIVADKDALETLSNLDFSNVREMEGTFTRAVALATLKNGIITPSVVSGISSIAEKSSTPPHVTHSTDEQVIASVLRYYGVTHNELTGRRRTRKLIAARQAAMYIMSSNLGMGVTEISRSICRDHSTVSLTLKRLSKSVHTEPNIQADLDAINVMLSAQST